MRGGGRAAPGASHKPKRPSAREHRQVAAAKKPLDPWERQRRELAETFLESAPQSVLQLLICIHLDGIDLLLLVTSFGASLLSVARLAAMLRAGARARGEAVPAYNANAAKTAAEVQALLALAIFGGFWYAFARGRVALGARRV